MNTYYEDRNWADPYLPKQMEILQPILAMYYPPIPQISSWRKDVHYAADLTVYRHDDIDIGVRVRRPKYAKMFGLTQWTMRCLRSSGAPTELGKITNGNGQWFAYFHSDEQGELPHWLIVDLEGFRLNFETMTSGPLKGTYGSLRDNGDGTLFKAFDVHSFPVGILLAASESVRGSLHHAYRDAIRRRQSRQWEPYKGLQEERKKLFELTGKYVGRDVPK